MQISIAIPSLNFCGGAEAVTVALIKLLKEQGYSIKLLTVDKPDQDKIKSILGEYIQPDEEFFVIKRDFTTKPNLINSIRLLELFSKMLYNAKKSNNFIINMYGEYDLAINLADISYINSLPMKLRQGNGILKKNIFRFYNRMKKITINDKYALAISNSYYIHDIIIERMHMDTIVVHPPIKLESIKESKKDDLVLTISRISPDKELEKILYLADMLREYDLTFIIIGRIYDVQYYKKLVALIHKLKVDEMVTLLPNEPRDVILDYLAKSKILFHTMNNEGYGLTVIEGMLAGCIPIVPYNGGPWIDILTSKNGIYGFSYKNLGDACMYITMLLNENTLANDIKARAIVHARKLADEFSIKFPKLLELVLKDYKII